MDASPAAAAAPHPHPHPHLRCPSCHDLESPHLIIPRQNLDQGVESGCAACSLVKEAVGHFCPLEEVHQISLLVDCALYLRVIKSKTTQVDDAVTVELYCDEGKPSIWKNIGPGRTPSQGHEPTETLSLVKDWLKDCQERHTSCRINTTAAAIPLPTRVIEVGTSSEDVRLKVSSQGETGNYAALSHCWGGHVPVMTTKATLTQYQSKLSFNSASQTFADAVEVTRHLGLRYLWIDSLCIVQDDGDDWAREAAKMSDLYRNATITLSADAAEDASGGLFKGFTDRHAAHATHPILTTDANSENVIIYARKRGTCPTNPRSAPHSSLPVQQPSKLSTRGWVLQERILSPRMVHFYREETVWSCYGMQRCECRRTAGVSSSATIPRLLAKEGGQSAQDLLLEWPRIVEQYTAKDLTFAKDRLPAISGVARLIMPHLKSPYIAGHWASDMTYSLLWMSDHDARTSHKPIGRMPSEPRYAPTWSWASIDGPVKYIDRHMDQFSHRRSGRHEIKPVCKAIRTTADDLTSDAFGPVTSGIVTVQGQVLPIQFNFDLKLWAPVSFSRKERPGPGSASSSSFTTTEQSKRPRIEPRFIYDVLSESPEIQDPQICQTRRFVLLRAATYIWGGTVSSQSTEVFALLLALIGISDGFPVFKRLGVVLHAFHSIDAWQGIPVLETIIV